jgi:hypothetical protein
MTCPACQDAQANPWLCGSYQANCLDCEARAFAQSPQARDALLGYPEALQGAMRQIWPTQEQYRQGRLSVYRWIKLIDEAKEKQ